MAAERAGDDRSARFVFTTRTFSGSPLARHHDKLLDDGGRRKITPIPWSTFRREKYHEEALKLAGYANTALATGEYGAICTFSRITASMAIHGVPFDFISAASRVATDEMRHADYAAHFAEKCIGTKPTLKMPKKSLDSSPMTLAELDKMVLELAAIGEAFACGLIAACLDRAEDAVARALFGNLLRDEVHHARLGFHYLEWRAPQWSRAEKQALADAGGKIVMEVETRFCRGRDASKAAKKSADALGVLDSKSQIEASSRVTEEEIVPALDALGLGASHAWRVRKRVA